MSMCVCVCVCVKIYMCVYVYLASISSLMHISWKNVDKFCLHLFVYILSSCRIDFMVSDGNWLMKLPQLILTLILSARYFYIRIIGEYISFNQRF